MSKILLLALTVSLFPQLGFSYKLPDTIRQNIEDVKSGARAHDDFTARYQSQPRLWIHVERQSQVPFAEELLSAVSDVHVGGKLIENKPVQLVNVGPSVSQLRYFHRTDQQQAIELFGLLRQSVPDLQLRDFSSEYSAALWIEPGHYELWLSRRVQ